MEGLVRAERVEHMSIFVCLSVKLASMMRKLASMMRKLASMMRLV